MTPPGARFEGARKTFRFTARIRAPAVSRKKFFHSNLKFIDEFKILRIARIVHPRGKSCKPRMGTVQPRAGRGGRIEPVGPDYTPYP